MQTEDLRRLVERVKAARPELTTRAEKAAAMLVTRRISPVGVAGYWWVDSQSKPKGERHLVVLREEKVCDCFDHKSGHAPSGWCKHLIAVAVLTVAAQRGTAAQRSERFADLIQAGIPIAAALQKAQAS